MRILRPWFARHWDNSVDWSMPGKRLAEKTVKGFEKRDLRWNVLELMGVRRGM